MNILDLKAMIHAAQPVCPEPDCGEPFSEWPEADQDEGPVMYVGRDALFAGVCSKGHSIEFWVAELKEHEVIAHTRTERTLGKKIAQKDCDHQAGWKVFQIPEGVAVMTKDGPVEGPADIAICPLCCVRKQAVKVQKPARPTQEPPEPPSRLILP